MPILWENYSGSGLGLKVYIFRILDSILQPMHDSGTQVYGERELSSALASVAETVEIWKVSEKKRET